MLILGQRNDDSLARDVDWFGSSERLEISPASIWVPDEDETIRQRRVTAHRPPVVEEDFDYYWSLHEINPQVSVSDEDSSANPRTLPEINPHVSVRDEDSFTSGVCGMDDSKVQPGEPSFVSVTVDGQNEKTFIQEYMGLGPSFPTELESDRLSELESSHLTEPESNHSAEIESSHSTELESSQPVVSARVRVLDESQVLPGEASFATAIPSGPFAPGSHSPLQEFLAKTNLELRTFMLASLLFVSIIGVSALVIMEATTGVFSSKFLASAAASGTSPKADSATPQSQAIQTTRAVPPNAVSKLSEEESQTIAPPREYPKLPQEAAKPMSLEGSFSELSRKAHSNDIRA